MVEGGRPREDEFVRFELRMGTVERLCGAYDRRRVEGDNPLAEPALDGMTTL